jgi:hypothetical protein
MKDSPFVDFAVTRNVLLEFADDKYDYLLLLDSNDEVKDGKLLRKLIVGIKSDFIGFYLTQMWWNGVTLDRYFNIKLIKTKEGWRYNDPVHEYIMCPKAKENAQKYLLKLDTSGNALNNVSQDDKYEKNSYYKKTDGIVIYQDRTFDDDKSKQRFLRDRSMLYRELQKYVNYIPTINSQDFIAGKARILFYLAQTCMCIGQLNLAFKYYKKRTKLGGFMEEVYHSYVNCGRIGFKMKYEWEECKYYLDQAYKTIKRVEPLLYIVEYYFNNPPICDGKKNYLIAYHYCKQACELEYPQNLVLFINRRSYSYERYHWMSKILLNLCNNPEKIKEGKEYCQKALLSGSNLEVDIEIKKKYDEMK